MKLVRPAELLADGRAPFVSSSWADHLARTPPSSSPGLDIVYKTQLGRGSVVPAGTKAIAAAGGKVVSVRNTERGVVVIIDAGRGLALLYRHLENPIVKAGEEVMPAEIIGDIGHDPTDRAKKRHLHFELWLQGKRIDPGPLFELLPSVRAGDAVTKETSAGDVIRAVTRGKRTAEMAKKKKGVPSAPPTAPTKGQGYLWLVVIVGLLLMSSKN